MRIRRVCWLTVMTVVSQVVAVQTNLAGAVGDCLDRLLVADLAFWVDSEVFNISKPAKIVSLYYERLRKKRMQSLSSSLISESSFPAFKIFLTRLMKKFLRGS